MMLRRCLKGMEYLHATLLFAMLVPLIYAMVEWSDPAGTGILYLKCMLIAVPVIVTERASKSVKSFIFYVMICIALLAGMGCITGLIAYLTGEKGRFEGYGICYCAGLLAETFFIVIKRFIDRVKTAEMKREEPLAAAVVSFLDNPTFSLVWYFVAFYMLGICLSAELLCDIAFYSAILYTFLALFYEYFGATRAYLEMNRRTKGISKRRLYGISFSMFLVFAVLLLAGIMPAVFMAGQRQYTNIRTWFDNMKFEPYAYESDSGFQQPASGGMEWMELLNDGKPAPEPSKLANAVLWMVGTICILAFLYGVLQIIRQVLRDFRNSCDENGDVIEELDEGQMLKQGEEMISRRGLRGVESEAERIRRRYRRMIRKHRKERPAPYESPTEIEEYAGLKNDEQMELLHRQYEEVRYGK